MLLGHYRASMPLYIEKQSDYLVCVTHTSWTHRQTLKERDESGAIVMQMHFH